MGVEFDPIVGLQTGGAPILSYWLEIDSTGSGSGPYTEVGGFTTNSLQTNYVIEGLVSGQMYYLRYRAKNAQGWSTLPSTVTAILMASAPSKIAPPATTSMSGTKVQVSWTAPSNPGGTGVTIDAYRIKFRQKDGLMKEITSECDGTQGPIKTG